jgi:ribosome-binding factor A
MSQRTDRVDELLRQEIGSIVAKDVADPRVGFVTITSVETTPDLRHAKVWVSVIGQPEERDAAVSALRHAMPFIRHELGQRLRIKRIPDLHVHLDDTAERGTRILQLLAEIDSGAIPAPDQPMTESLPTPVARVHQVDDLPEEPPSAVRVPVPARPRSHRAGGRPKGAKGGSHKSSRRAPR